MEKPTLELMQSIAHLKDGKCLSKQYINASSPLKWMCTQGHTWDAPYTIIKQGGWCRQCVKSEYKADILNQLKTIAKSKGGKCISKEYINSDTKLAFQCAKGHQWNTRPYSIRYGHWCPECSGVKKLSIEVFQKIAKKRKGVCLSKVYNNLYTKLKWQCAKGHVWKATGYSIKDGKSWCPVCAHRVKFTIADVIKHIKPLGGECFSFKYDPQKNLKLRCAQGHSFQMLPRQLFMGRWCRICRLKEAGKKRSIPYCTYLSIAKKHKGKLLTPPKQYVNGRTPMLWQCTNGHQWKAQPKEVKRGSWCLQCSYDKRKKK